MKLRELKLRSDCPISYTLDIFGDKWSLLIVRDLLLENKKYYNEFLKSDEKISTNILADRLSRLESQEIVSKRTDETHRSRILYVLTDKGMKLLPLLLEMLYWGSAHSEECRLPDSFMQAMETDREQLIEDILETFK